jgi:hypothetical protein
MTLSKDQKFNLAVFVSGGVLLGIGSIVFRTIATFGIPESSMKIQYSLVYAFLGTLLAAQLPGVSKTRVIKIAYTILILALGVGALIPPESVRNGDIAIYLTYLMIAFGLGAIYRNYWDPTGVLYVLAVAAFAHEFFMYGTYYCVRAFQETGSPLYLIALLILLAIIHTFRNMLADELAQLQDERIFARGLSVFLKPQERVKSVK